MRTEQEQTESLEAREMAYIFRSLRDADQEHPITGKSLAVGLAMETGCTYSAATIRSIVHLMRMQGIAILASSRGYFLAESPEAAIEHSQRMRKRALSILAAARSLRQAAADLVDIPVV